MRNPWYCGVCKFQAPTMNAYGNHVRYRCPASELDRFWALIEKEGHGGCWVYTGHRNRDGYGAIRIQGVYLAHRLTWTLKNGPIPKGRHALHKCNNPPCCNPDHIYLGDDADNSRDRVAVGNTTWGERSSKAKLTEEQVREIRAGLRWINKRRTNSREFADKFGVETQTIIKAWRGVSWPHLKSM